MLLPLQVVCSKLASKARLFLLHYKLLETRYKKTQALMGATRLASGKLKGKIVILSDSSLCQNGKQVEIITKMIFELCYIEAILRT